MNNDKPTESSHSPTEQPGDAALRQGFSEIEPPMGDFILKQTDIPPLMLAHGAYYHYSQVSILLRRKQAELVAENQKYAVAQKGNLARLDELNTVVKGIWEILEVPLPLIMLENANGIHLLDFIRSLKSDRDAWKGMIVPILDFAQQHGKQLGIRPGESIPEKVLEILKSALSGGSK